MGGLFNLVLGVAVQHVFGGDSLNGQDDIAGAQIGRGRLTARSDLTGRNSRLPRFPPPHHLINGAQATTTRPNKGGMTGPVRGFGLFSITGASET